MKNFCMFVLGFVSLMATACGGGVDYPVDANSGGVGGGETSEASGPSTSSYSSSVTTSVGSSGEGGSTTSTADSSASSGGGEGGASASTSVGVGGAGGGEPIQILVQLAADPIGFNIVTPAQGAGDLHVVTVYEVVNGSNTDQTVTTVHVDQMNANGDIADVGHINLTVEGVSGLSVYAPGWVTSPFDVDNTKHFVNGPVVFDPNGPSSWVIPAGGTIKIKITVGFAMPQSSAAVNGAWHGVPRSGHTPALQITHLETTDAVADIVPHTAPIKVLRKSKPIITKHPLVTNTLANVDQDLLKWQVAADPAGGIAWGQMRFGVVKTQEVTVSNFTLRRGASDLPLSDYEIVTADFQSQVTDNILMAGSSTWTMDVILNNEQTIVGPGYVYTLHATVSGAVAGSEFNIQLIPDNFVATGYLANVANGIFIISDMNGTVPASSVFSDLSEVPHQFDIALNGGSSDWFPGLLVPGLETMQEHLSL